MELNYKVIIIGAGPAGLQLSYYLNKVNVSHIVLERAKVAGSFFETYPVHRKLISINKVNTGFNNKEKNLRWDWNSLLNGDDKFSFKDFDKSYYPSADNLVKYLGEFATKYELPIHYETHVAKVTKDDHQFTVVDGNGKEYVSEILVDATGIGELNIPNIKGIEHSIAYTEMNNDVAQFTNKKVLILGKGNSAFETADSLLEVSSNTHLISPDDFNFAWVSHYPGHLRSVNQAFLDTFFLKQQNAILNGRIASIEQLDSGQYLVDMIFSEDGESEKNTYDYVINCTGFKCNFDHYAPSTFPELCLKNMFPKLNHKWESSNIPNLFFCGANMQCNDYKDSSTPFIHGIRHNAESLSEIIIKKLNLVAQQSRKQLDSSSELYNQISERIKSATTIWFLFGNAYDLYSKKPNGGFEFFESVPKLVYENEEQFKQFSGFRLEFSYRIPSDKDEQLKFSQHGFLHPVVSKYKNGELVDEVHMLEDIYGEWEDLSKLDNGIKELIVSNFA
ncbi:NAD(P)-binding domain-containing protein [Pseudoalteromonas sp. L23]|uniref:NAD(P)-binding domain-containing protein n=1 Tax=unclassified Pseudoalteromonas TaxID=194690 RepID=UPI001EEF9DFE|nr:MULTISPECIES: NAD(P)-binding domain-containing protein [unclassified Pseudoalteromonas]MCF7513284.1 NAD(P)-binding domain-containing protein [Pseudoalteromonas sp. L7]MCF7525324.1 NAD(P)-binding domain-containing protein [Pseudoalteromonas sp. L23]